MHFLISHSRPNLSLSYELDDPLFIQLVNDTDRVMRLAGPGNILSLLPWTRHLAPQATGFRALCDLRDATCGLFGEIVEEHRRTLNPEKPRDYVDAFLMEMEKEDAQEKGFTSKSCMAMLCFRRLFVAKAAKDDCYYIQYEK